MCVLYQLYIIWKNCNQPYLKPNVEFPYSAWDFQVSISKVYDLFDHKLSLMRIVIKLSMSKIDFKSFLF